MRQMILIAAALTLAACATPEERCISRAQSELASTDRLIAETRMALAVGYRTETVQPRVTVGIEMCSGDNVRICVGGENGPSRVQVPIDRAAEQRRLLALTERRQDLAARVAGDTSGCVL